MTDKLSSATVVCEGGLDSTKNHILLDSQFPGRASALLNYETSLDGGYRRIGGYRAFNQTYKTVDSTNAEGPILGLGILNLINGNDIVYTARKQKSGNTYKFYKYDPLSGWAVQTHASRSSIGVNRIRHAQFVFGNVAYIIFVDGANPAIVTDGTTWWVLTSAGTGTSGSPGGNQIVDLPAAVAIFRGHVFLSADTAYKSVVCHSAPQDVFNWTAAAGAGQLVAPFLTTQIKPWRDQLYIFGANDINKIEVSGTDFIINNVTTNIGVYSPDAVIEINGDLVFLAPDGIRPISGTNKISDVNMEILSKPIQAAVKKILQTYSPSNIIGTVIRNKSQMRIFATDGTTDGANAGIMGALRGPDTWEFGELQGFRPNVVESGYLNDRENVIFGDFSGNIILMEAGNSFDGDNIFSVYSTPYLTLGDTFITKLMRSIRTFYKAEGDFNVALQLNFDWGDSTIVNPDSYTQSTTSEGIVFYDAGQTYDSGMIYGGGTDAPVICTTVEGSFLSIRLTFTTNDTNPSHSINGFVIELTQQERR